MCCARFESIRITHICNMHVQHYSCLRMCDRSFICLLARLHPHARLRHCSMNEHRLLICLPEHNIICIFAASAAAAVFISLFIKKFTFFDVVNHIFFTAFRFFFTFLHSKWFVQSMHIVLQSDDLYTILFHMHQKSSSMLDWPTEWKRDVHPIIRFISKKNLCVAFFSLFEISFCVYGTADFVCASITYTHS